MRSHDSEEPINKEPIAEKTGSSSLVVANQVGVIGVARDCARCLLAVSSFVHGIHRRDAAVLFD